MISLRCYSIAPACGAAAAVLLSFSLWSCSQPKPPGPAERIGKGVDEIIYGIRDFDREGDGKSRAADLKQQGADAYKRQGSVPSDKSGQYVPECDPLFDPECKSDYWRGREDAAGASAESLLQHRAPVQPDSAQKGQNERRY